MRQQMNQFVHNQYFRSMNLNSNPGQLELYRQQFYNLTLKINLLEVQLSHKRKQITLLLEELEEKNIKNQQKQLIFIALQNQTNNLKEQNRWLEDQMTEYRTKLDKTSSNEIMKLNAIIQAKNKQIRQLEYINSQIAKESQEIKLKDSNNRQIIEELESKLKLSVTVERDSGKLRQEELSKKLDMLIKKIEVKPEAKLNRMFNSRLLSFPTNSTMDAVSKGSGYQT